MPKRIALTNMNGRTIDILNVIRSNASYEYQSLIPAINDAQGIPMVGETLYGNPTLCNEFINALVNRVALVVVNSAIFNNPYAMLKKGYIEYGESIEEIFVQIANVQEYSAEKAPSREFKRTIPDVKSAFHVMNWRVLYPVTIQREDLRRAFLSADGVENMITSIIDQIYTAANYDEFLLFKYLLIKAVVNGKAFPYSVDFPISPNTETETYTNAAVAFRSASNMLTFMSNEYNEAGVLTNTPKDRQYIFMDAEFNARFDVEVLASAFNMDKADFMGRLLLIDNWTSFDNERWAEIRANSDMVDEITDDDLTIMSSVKAILVDERFFQVYDNASIMTDQRVASGLYWNYFYHVWKTVSTSPFSNVVAFVDSQDTAFNLPDALSFTISAIETNPVSTIITLEIDKSRSGVTPGVYKFIQGQTETASGIAVHEYGAYIIPVLDTPIESITPTVKFGEVEFTANNAITIDEAQVGDQVTFGQK